MIFILSLWCHLICYWHANCGCEMINGLKRDFCFSNSSCFLSKFHLHQNSESILIVGMPVFSSFCVLLPKSVNSNSRRFSLSFLCRSSDDLRNKWTASESNHIERIWIKKKSNKFTYIFWYPKSWTEPTRMKHINKYNKQTKQADSTTAPHIQMPETKWKRDSSVACRRKSTSFRFVPKT